MPMLFLVLAAILALTCPAPAATHFSTNATWKYFKGTTEASLPDRTSWRALSFNDASWSEGQAPFYFDTGPSSTLYTGRTHLPDMQGSYSHLFLRKRFVVNNPLEVYALKLRFQVDDGFVLWVNGQELLRQGVTAQNTLTNGSSTTISTEPPPLRVVDLTAIRPAAYLVPGDNVMAIQLLNANRTDNDLLFDLGLDTTTAEGTRPSITTVNPGPGQAVTQLKSIAVTFSEAVVGVDAGDLIVNGSPCDTVTQAGNTFSFAFPEPVKGGVSITWDPDHNIIDASLLPNTFDALAAGSRWTYTLVDTQPPTVARTYPPHNARVRSLSQVEVEFSEGVEGVEAADLRINGQGATNLLVQPGGKFTFQFPPPDPGIVNLQWRPDHGITDVSAAALAFAGGSWVYTLDPQATLADVVVSEIMAANKSGIQDEDGEPEGWIELWNRGLAPVNLNGWSLSDDEDEPGKWVFPAVNLGTGQRLVVFASGKDRLTPVGGRRFHTNFKLGLNGEFLGLFSPDSPRRFASGFSEGYPEQRNDTSYGLDSSGALRFFSPGTPGTPNGVSSVVGVVDAVQANVERGFFRSSFDLMLACGTPGAIIRYTRDGSEPTETRGQIYYQPVRLTNTTILRAAAFRANHLPSRVVTHSYLFNTAIGIRSIPVLSIVTASNNLTGPTGIIGMNGGSRGGSGEFIVVNPNTDYHNPSQHGIAWERPISAELIHGDDNSGFQIDCGLRVQGSDWQRPRTTPDSKFSFRLYFRSDYGESKLRYPLMPGSPVQEFDQVVLRAGFNDPVNPFIRDEFGRQLSDDMGMVASHGTFVNLFINGVHKGHYNPAERVEESTLREYHGGGPDWDVIGQFGQIVDGDRDDLQRLLDLASRTNTATAAGFQAVAARLDVENFIDYLVLNIHASMGDWPANNWRAARDRSPGGLWRFYVWDAEWGFGFSGRSSGTDTFAESGGGPSDSGLGTSCEIGTLYQRLALSPEFKRMFADRVHKHLFNEGALTETNINRRFGEMRTQLAQVIPSMDSSILEWTRQRRPVVLGLYQRYGLLASSNAPGLNRLGGRIAPGTQITLTNLGGTIHYTLDGTDPREAFTGDVKPAALTYSAPLILNGNARLRARTFRNFSWSALTEADYTVEGLGVPLRITEIMANPTGGGAFEYLELQNTSDASIDVSGVWLEGISFVFPDNTILGPGERVVLASGVSAAQFSARYPGVPVLGSFSGSLNNSGERLTLHEKEGRIIQTVDYLEGEGWPVADEANGLSLELANFQGDPDLPSSWRASSAQGGTPGRPNNTDPESDIRLNEVMAWNVSHHANGAGYPDWIELHNAGSNAVNIAGWGLSRSTDPWQYRFPANTSIASGGYLVVWCDSDAAAPGLHAGFSLSRSGDSVRLHDASGRRVDTLGFGNQPADFSIGWIEGVWSLCTPSPASPNTPALPGAPGSLAINEWMANPLSNQPDWIELYNRDLTAAVDLSGLYLSNSNNLHRLPPLSFLGPGAHVQMIADEAPGADHVDFKLPASGGRITLHDSTGVELQRVTYSRQTEGISQGRMPDGAASITTFSATPSPGAANYLIQYSGPVVNEFMARPLSGESDWLEFHNPGNSAVDLGGYSLSLGEPEPGQWLMPTGAVIQARGYLLVNCDPLTPPSTTLEPRLNCGRGLPSEGGGIHLFDPTGRAAQFVRYGFQLRNQSLGLVSNQWRLLESATPGEPNSVPAVVGSMAQVRLNEWMANPRTGNDWLELHNTTNVPVSLGGAFLTDDPSLSGTNLHAIAPLSFIDAQSWVVFQADADPDSGPDHLSFSLNASGDSLRLYTTNGALVDGIDFEAQEQGFSQGRLPDAHSGVATFPHGGTPGTMNHQEVEGLQISELLLNPGTPEVQGVELSQAADAPADLSGWWLTDDPSKPGKYRLPEGTLLGAGEHRQINQSAFNSGSSPMTLDSLNGGQVWLIEPGPDSKPTGRAVRALYGPLNGEGSLIRWSGYPGVAYLRSRQPTPGSVNAPPATGPLVITELMINPSSEITNGGRDEYIEIHNQSPGQVTLAVAGSAESRWRIRGGVSLDFVGDRVLAAGQYLLVVSFDPATNAAALGQFRTRYGLGVGTLLVGPYSGRLGNDRDEIRLERRPDATSKWTSAEVLERVDYDQNPPWPASGPGAEDASIHRSDNARYSNDPFAWHRGRATPGGPAPANSVAAPIIIQPPLTSTATAGTPTELRVHATGTDPLRYQWRRNGNDLPGDTNSTLLIAYTQPSDEALYEVMVSNEGGTVLTVPARLSVVSAPLLVIYPENRSIRRGTNVVLQALAIGTEPIRYEWRFRGELLPGGTSGTLPLGAVQLEDAGSYRVTAINAYGSNSVEADISVLAIPIFSLHPQPLVALEGQTVQMSAAAQGNNPITYRWQRNSATVSGQTTSVLRLAGVTLSQAGNYSLVASNIAGRTTSSNAALIVYADADRDGMADPWETAHGLNPGSAADANLDSDGDGLSNRVEYLAGSNPKNAADRPSLRVAEVRPQQLTLQFTAPSNRLVTVESRDEFTAGAWQPLQSFPRRGTNRTESWVVPFPMEPRERFFRLDVSGAQ